MEKHPNVRGQLFWVVDFPRPEPIMMVFLLEDPYPFAIDEAFDTYRLMIESCTFYIILGMVQNLIYPSWQAYWNVWKETANNTLWRFCVCFLQSSHGNATILIFTSAEEHSQLML